MKKFSFDTANLFKFEGDVDKSTQRWLVIFGWIGLVLTWWLISVVNIIPDSILPTPFEVLKTYKELLLGAQFLLNPDGTPAMSEMGTPITVAREFSFGALFEKNHLLYHIGFSGLINVLGYLEAVAIALPLGFLIALYPAPRYIMQKQFDAIRFLPLPAATGIFIAAFGMGLDMKIHFLAAGILVYLLPIVVQRVVETEKAHKQTMHTLGATVGKKLRYLYIPSVISRVFVDIIVLVAISWTYITVIEVINNVGGLGGVANAAGRGRIDIVYAILVLVILIGVIQDKLLRKADRKMFPYKYV
jgi:NitT/TauT family transport system permease protein